MLREVTMLGKSRMPSSPELFRKIPLQLLLIIPFVVQTVGAVAVVGYLSYRNGQKAVNDVATQLRNETSNRIKQNLTHLLAIPFQSFENYDAALSQNRINLNNGRDVEKFLWGQLPAFPLVAAAAFVTPNQEFFAGERQDDGTLVIRTSEVKNNHTLTTYTASPEGERREIINAGKPNFDPRKRPYYKIPVQQKQACWAKLYPHITGKYLYIAAGKPIYTKTGDLQGVWMTSLNMVMFGDFLSKLKIGKTGQSFILERSGEMIATSTGEKPFEYYPDKVVQLPEQRVERLKVVDSRNVITQKASQALLKQFRDFKNIQTSYQLKFAVSGKNYFVQVDPFRDSKGIDWLVVVTIPEDDFMSQIKANTQTTIRLCLVTLILVTLLGILTARWIKNPILKVAQASENIADGNLNQHVKSSQIIELETLANSFNSMAGQLKASFNILEEKNQALEDANESLRLAEENYRSIFENALEGIFQGTEDGHFIRINPAMARIYGYDSPQEMMATVTQIGSQIYVDANSLSEFYRRMKEDGKVKGFEYRVYRKDGSIIWVQEDARVVYDSNGNALYYEGLIQDITERKHREEDLQRQLQELRIEIDQNKREKDVAQITQSDYFQELQQAAANIQLDDDW
jgi:PAS domain S-box-containing protein